MKIQLHTFLKIQKPTKMSITINDIINTIVGKYVGQGHGSYPTINDFDYNEQTTFTRLGDKPIIMYQQMTKSADNTKPLHAVCSICALNIVNKYILIVLLYIDVEY